MGKRYWRIRSENALEPFEAFAPGSLSDSEVKVLLQRLACMALGSDEIIASSLRENAEGFQEHLEVRPIDVRKGGGWMTDGDPSWTAIIVER